ncbi:hypothetical protein SAMN04489724_1002 [Algoriphagus locisalis]|uniref:Uncharacterized protein n=1 Tax=Algoriphagus locisalis TaxID=305507 RepID=A0A1I6YGN0_9BACT|nr:hypothetical protein [Algoriphagus locisalis]SFT49686.1 hypothetical protein SAMN04489724_1002 [Algoriphagus locisalis]
MKKLLTQESIISLRRIFPFLFVLIFVPLFSYLLWLIYPSKELEVLIIDKTVPSDSYQEHQSIFWTLEHLKFKNSDGEFYQKERDYMGFYPDTSASFGTFRDFNQLSENEIVEKANELDVLFLTDTYGVFENDFKEGNSEEFSKKIYGGLNRGDINLLREVVAQNKTIVAEFNTMASPTSVGIRTEFENLMGIKWTGWIGRYFDQLDTTVNKNIPKWLISQYLEQHENTWVSPGPGIVFVHENSTVEVFTNGVDYVGETPKIRTQRMNQHGFKLPEIVPYPDWFDVVLIERDYQVISYYDIDPSELGKEKLREMGLPRFFPAAVIKDIGGAQYYYFAGDFSDLKDSMGSPHFLGLPSLWRGFHLISNFNDRESFYWNYYYPLLSQVLEKTYEKKKENQLVISR